MTATARNTLASGPLIAPGPRGINRRGEPTFGAWPFSAIVCMDIAINKGEWR